MKNVFFGSKNISSKRRIQVPIVSALDVNTIIYYSSPEIPFESSGEDTVKVINDLTNYDDINNGLSNFFNVNSGIGRNLYCFPEYGSELISYLRTTTPTMRSISRINDLVQSDLKKLSRISILNSAEILYDTINTSLSQTSSVILKISYTNSKIGSGPQQWSGLVYYNENQS